MNFILSEFMYEWKRDKKTIIVIMLISVIGMYCISIANHLLMQSRGELKEYNEVYENVQYYTLLDNFVGEKASVLEDQKSTDKMSHFLKLLQNSEFFDYLMIYEQPIYIEDYRGKENNIYGYEYISDLASKTIDIIDKNGNVRSSTNVKAFWFGENVAEYFELALSSGRNFENNDFVLNPNEPISVILGSNFADEYKIGDKIYLSYVFSESEATIIGFLDEGSNVYFRGNFRNLDNYIIMPIFQNDEYEGKNVYNFGLNHVYTLRNSGVIATRLSVEDTQEIITNYSMEVGLDEGYYITEYTDFAKQNFDIGVKIIFFALTIILILIIIVIVFLLGLCITNIINKNKKYYAILMLNGYGRGQICSLLVIELLIIFIISLFSVGLLCAFTLRSAFENIMSIWITLGLQIFFIFLIPITICIMFFMKADLIFYLNEEIDGCW